MENKKAIELRNLLVEDLKKNEKGLTAFLTKANEQSITPDQQSEACPVRDMGNRLTRRHK